MFMMPRNPNKCGFVPQYALWVVQILCFVLAKADTDVFMVLLKTPSILHYDGSLAAFPLAASLPNRRVDMTRQAAKAYSNFLVNSHDSLLQRTLAHGTYKKLYSYYYLINGFAVSMSSEQAAVLSRMPEVVLVEKDIGVQKLTTYTPTFLGLTKGAWAKEGGAEYAGEGIVIGLVDSGIDPTHPSFSDQTSREYTAATQFKGTCEVATEFPRGSCNGKLVGARHFAAAAIEKGMFNATRDFASPLDGDGHGTHTASIAAGNCDVAVEIAGMSFGLASGMAPRAHVAMYKALYRGFGGFFADVVAAINQAVEDGVDILSLSIGPNGPPSGFATFFNTFDIALLSAVKAGIFVTQAAGNSGPYSQSMLSFSPWICSVAASLHDRIYSNSVIVGDNQIIEGVGLAPGTDGDGVYAMVLASDAQKNGTRDQLLADVDECQDSSTFDKEKTQGKILVCSYTYSFLAGYASIRKVVATAQNLSVEGIVLVTSPELDGIELSGAADHVPIAVPAIIIPNVRDSEILLYYCNSSKATARILGGTNPTFSHKAPIVASYSSRGPDIADSMYHAADVLKPNVMAPGDSIWAGWTPISVESEDFQGQKFAMLSGTSMATPHIAGIAALIKQKNPKLSPAAIASALATTASVQDQNGDFLLAQNPSDDMEIDVGTATPFDMGSGAVNGTAAMDPGIVFDADFDDYVQFLCSIPDSSSTVLNTVGVNCSSTSPGLPTDLNSPFITVSNLNASRSIPRTVTNIAKTETYTVKMTPPDGVSATVSPMSFTLGPDESQELAITLEPTVTSIDPCFGSMVLSGSKGHIARIPIAVISTTKSA